MTQQIAPTFADIESAATRLQDQAVRTPLLEVPALNRASGGRILLKAEPLQRTGSFKFRGAFNFLSQIAPETRANGVVAYSSGNHAQGVAAAAQIFDVPATIVMPADAPQMKVENTQGYGATVVTYDRQNEDREAIAADLARQSGSTLVPPYDHPWTIAGQGTVGLEIAAQCTELGARPDIVLVCCGGGGLTAGVATAIAEIMPKTQVMTAEPEGFDDTRRSLEAGQRVTNDPSASSICDALLAPTPGELTFSIMAARNLKGVAVSDDDVRQAVAYAWRHFKIVVEPGGAVALAAILSGKTRLSRQDCCRDFIGWKCGCRDLPRLPGERLDVLSDDQIESRLLGILTHHLTLNMSTGLNGQFLMDNVTNDPSGGRQYGLGRANIAGHCAMDVHELREYLPLNMRAAPNSDLGATHITLNRAFDLDRTFTVEIA